jgi:Ca-activated chloride channel family protein
MLETLSSQLLALNEFHFLRPWWLLALLPTILFSWLLFRHRQKAGRWQTVIQADLLPFLLDGEGRQQQQHYFLWALLFWCLASIAIAGPSWTKIPLPIHKQQSPLVVLLDLSPSMLAEDLKPNRLTRARLKLTDFLGQRQEGTTALIAYADDAHVVTPLTDDTATIISLVPSLHPNIMPSAGSKPLAALQKGLEIILQAGHQGGDLLLISDGITNNDAEAITSLLTSMGGFRLSVLGLGSEDGAPIPSEQGGFVKDRRGDIVIARLNSKRLRKVARENNGRYAQLSANDSDLKHLRSGIDKAPDSDTEQLDRTFDTWQDNGFWLVLIALPLIFLGFRRNIIIMLILTPTLFYSEGSQAFEWTELSWEDLWKTRDQQGQEAFNSGNTDAAEEQFNNPSWKGAAAYRNENYDEAAQAFANNSPTSQYNRANSLAKTGQLEEALKAYDDVLASKPDHADAAFNKQLVEQLLNQEQQKQDQQQDQNQDQEQDGDESEDQSQQQSDQQENQQNSEQNQDQSSDNQSESQQDQNPQENQSEEQSENQSSKQENSEREQQESEQKQSEQQSQQTAELQDDLSSEQRQAMEQWLRRVPDDPGGLLRNKFAYEAWLKKQSSQQNTKQQESQRW